MNNIQIDIKKNNERQRPGESILCSASGSHSEFRKVVRFEKLDPMHSATSSASRVPSTQSSLIENARPRADHDAK